MKLTKAIQAIVTPRQGFDRIMTLSLFGKVTIIWDVKK